MTQVQGRVKWFNSEEGYGFILPDGGGEDILLAVNVLQNYGCTTIDENTEVTVEVEQTQRGLKATKIISITHSTSNEVAIGKPPIKPARVKWFNEIDGYGFLQIFGNTDDVYVGKEVLNEAPLVDDLKQGQAVGVRIVKNSRGLTAVEILPWLECVVLKEH